MASDGSGGGVTLEWLQERFGRAWSIDGVAPLLSAGFLRRVVELWPTMPPASPLKPRLLLALLSLPVPVAPDVADAARALVAAAASDASDDGAWGRVAAGLLATYGPVAVGEGETEAVALAALEAATSPLVATIRAALAKSSPPPELSELVATLPPLAAVALELARSDALPRAGGGGGIVGAGGAAGPASSSSSSAAAPAAADEPLELRDLPYELRLLPHAGGAGASGGAGGGVHCGAATAHEPGRHFTLPPAQGTAQPLAAVVAAARHRASVTGAAAAYLRHLHLAQVADLHRQVREAAAAAAAANGSNAAAATEEEVAAALAALPPAPTDAELDAAASAVDASSGDLLAYLVGSAAAAAGGGRRPAAGVGGGGGGTRPPGFAGARPGGAPGAGFATGKSFKRQREAPQAIDKHADELRTKVAKLEAAAAGGKASSSSAPAAATAEGGGDAPATSAGPTPGVSPERSRSASAHRVPATAAEAAAQREKLRRQLDDAPLLSPEQRAVVALFLESDASEPPPAGVDAAGRLLLPLRHHTVTAPAGKGDAASAATAAGAGTVAGRVWLELSWTSRTWRTIFKK